MGWTPLFSQLLSSRTTAHTHSLAHSLAPSQPSFHTHTHIFPRILYPYSYSLYLPLSAPVTLLLLSAAQNEVTIDTMQAQCDALLAARDDLQRVLQPSAHASLRNVLSDAAVHALRARVGLIDSVGSGGAPVPAGAPDEWADSLQALVGAVKKLQGAVDRAQSYLLPGRCHLVPPGAILCNSHQ